MFISLMLQFENFNFKKQLLNIILRSNENVK